MSDAPAETVRRFEKNVRANLVRFALTGPVTLWMVREVHRSLNTGDFGLWALLSLPAANFYLFDLGGVLALTRLVADARGREATGEVGPLVASLGAAYAAVLALASCGAAAFCAADASGRAAPVAWALAATLAGFAALPLQGLLAGYERLDLVNLWMAVVTCTQAALVVPAASRGVAGLMGAQLVANLVGLAGVAGAVRAVVGWPAPLAPARAAGRALAHAMGAVWPAQMYGVLVMHGDKLVLSAVSGLEAAGQMDLIGRLPGYVRFLAIKVADPLLPAAARLAPLGEHEALGKLVGSALARTAWVWVVGATGLAVFARELFGLWLGGAAAPVVAGLRAIAVSFAVHSFTTLLWFYWAGAGPQRLALVYVLGGTAAWLAGSLAGAATAGVTGATCAHLAVSITVSAVALACSTHAVPPGALPRLGRALVRAVPTAAVAAAAGTLASHAAGTLAGLAVYCAVAGAALAAFAR